MDRTSSQPAQYRQCSQDPLCRHLHLHEGLGFRLKGSASRASDTHLTLGMSVFQFAPQFARQNNHTYLELGVVHLEYRNGTTLQPEMK